MDSDSIVGQDVGLCTTVVDPVFATKESPSHESDSGCSDMYEDRSVSPNDIDLLSTAGTVDQVDMFDFESISNEEDLDNELAGYLSVSQPVQDEPEFVARKLVKRRSPVIDMDSDSSDDPDYNPVNRNVVQAKAIRMTSRLISATTVGASTSHVAPKVMQDICVLPSSSRANTITINNASAPRLPAVKVVKVIKTNSTSRQDVGNELMLALDERNKKNAVQAKINRERKKAYIQSLEEEISDLKSENMSLKIANDRDKTDKQALTEEVEYLKCVLANQSALAGLLKNIGNSENVKLSSISRKRSAAHDHDYEHSAEKRSKSERRAGVCLHVDQGSVSLEFCSKCSSMSKSPCDDDNS